VNDPNLRQINFISFILVVVGNTFLPTHSDNCSQFIHKLLINGKFGVINTHSCIKELLVVKDFCFWAIWAAGPVVKKWVNHEQHFFFMFLILKILIFSSFASK
jgi:hypothetical protein